MVAVSLGFLTPSHENIRLIDYGAYIGDQSLIGLKGDPNLAQWTPNSNVQISFVVDLDLVAILEECGIYQLKSAIFSPLGLTIGWKSTLSGLHGSSPVEVVTDGLNQISYELDGSLLGGDLIVTLYLILREDNFQLPGGPVPRRAGSRLWESTLTIPLEGDGSQMPTSAFDFGAARFSPQEAMWKIDIENDLQLHVTSAIRLKLNSGHPRIKHYLADPKSLENREFFQFLRADSIVQMIVFALHTEFEDLKSQAEELGSLAYSLTTLHSFIFPGQAIESTLQIFQSDPSFLTARVQEVVFDPNSKLQKL